MHNDVELMLGKSKPRKASKSPPTQMKKDKMVLPKLNVDPMKDSGYVRRLKMANYGKWYLQPKEYGNKVNKINKELRIYSSPEAI